MKAIEAKNGQDAMKDKDDKLIWEALIEESVGQPDDFTGAEPDHLHDPADDGSHRNDFLRMKVSKAVKDIDNADFIKEVIETIWAMREEAGILPPDEIPHDMMDDETHDEPRGLSDQEKWG